MSTMNKEKIEPSNTLDQFSVFYDYLKTIPRMWALFLVLAVLGGTIGYYVSIKNYTPLYTASTSFTVNAKSEQSISAVSEFYDNMAAEQIAQTFPYILTSDILRRKVEADLGTSFSGEITASVVESTNLLTLSVTDKDPEMAYKTLESVIKNYPSVSEPVVGKVTMNFLDETGVPTKPVNSNEVSRNIYSGALFGLTFAILWSVLIYFVNKTIMHKNEIKKLGIDCLGSIPKVTPKKRSKSDLEYYLITDQRLHGVLDEPYRMIRNKIEYIAEKNEYKTFLITSATAAEGKSIFATNLAISLALSGSKVILIDCDMRHPSGKLIFNMDENTQGLYEYLSGTLSLNEYLAVSDAYKTHTNENLVFLPGGKPIADGSTMLANDRMEELIAYAKANADYVILDTAPTGILTDSAVVAKYVDAGILVIRQDFARIDIIYDALSHLAESDTPVIGGVLSLTTLH